MKGEVKVGDTVELTENITPGMHAGDRFTIYAILRPEEAFDFANFKGGFAVSVSVPNDRAGFTALVPLHADEFEVVDE